MNPFRLLLCALPLFAIGSCRGIIFSKKQTEFAKNISSMLEGARVNLSVTATSSSSEGNYKMFEIEIEGLPLDSTNADDNILFASSIPAFVFYKDTVADRKSYKYINTVIKVGKKEYETLYTPYQMRQVDECSNMVAAYIGALKNENIDTLRYYNDSSINDTSVLSLVDKLKVADARWGAAQSHITKGFRLDEENGRRYIYFRFYLKRQALNQGAKIYVDPDTKKVIGYSM